MSGHNLMQAIARVNRVFNDKAGGLVVDYIGIAKALKQAMHDYTAVSYTHLVEVRLRKIGHSSKIARVHPHKFRRTLATMAIDKGMPVEQVQKLLGHVKIDTTMHYAMVNQNNVKLSHRKYIN